MNVSAANEIFEEALQHVLRPIGDLVDDASVTEIMVNGPSTVYFERAGQLHRASNRFPDERALLACARNIAQYSGKHIDEHVSRFDGRLPDGSRVHVVLPPCARNGITVSIRKFSKDALTLDRLVSFGSLDAASRELLWMLVRLDQNVLVSGGTGSGKTQLLNALSGAITGADRIVVIEDTSELRLQQEHVVSLETRAADRHGRGAVSIRELLHSSLRLRPDRILVGECRSGEALDMIQAMNSGHAGSMTTVHANSPADALKRLETLALLSDVDIPLVPLRAQIASALHVVVQTHRFPDGSRKVEAIDEVLPLDEQGRYRTRKLMRFVQSGRGDGGEVIGRHEVVAQPAAWPLAKARGVLDDVPHLVAALGPPTEDEES